MRVLLMVVMLSLSGGDVIQPKEKTETDTKTETVDKELAPTTAKDVLNSVENVIDAARAGQWTAMVGAIIMVIVNLLKLPALGGLVKKIPSRWRIILPIGLGGIGGVFTAVALGIPWGEAIIVMIFSGPTAVFSHELFVEAVFGKAKTRQPPPEKKPEGT